jgi:hypothetical protein
LKSEGQRSRQWIVRAQKLRLLSNATALLNELSNYNINYGWRSSAEILNLLDRKDRDIDYAFESRITPTADPALTNVFHSVEPFPARFG